MVRHTLLQCANMERFFTVIRDTIIKDSVT